MIKKLNKILINRWIIALLIIPFIKPASELTGKFDTIFDLLKIANCFIIIGTYYINFKKISKILLTISLFELTFLISTIINGGTVWWGIVQVVSIISICALLELTMKLDLKESFIGFSIAFGIMATATAITMFCSYPKGLYQVTGANQISETSNYLWGFDNSSIFKFIPAIIIVILCTYQMNNKNKIIGILFLLVTTSAFIYVKSITAAVACLIILATYIFLLIRKKSIKILNLKNIMIVITGIMIVLIVFNKNIKILQDIAQKTNKVYSLNGRFIIWENTLMQFFDNSIIGVGFEERAITSKKIGLDHPHNIFLDVLYRGGIVGIIIFFAIIVLIIKNNKISNNMTIEDNIVNIGILTIMFVSQMDYYNDQYSLFLLFILAYYSKLISNKENDKILNDGEKNDEK